jgi:hypothetical protein
MLTVNHNGGFSAVLFIFAGQLALIYYSRNVKSSGLGLPGSIFPPTPVLK